MRERENLLVGVASHEQYPVLSYFLTFPSIPDPSPPSFFTPLSTNQNGEHSKLSDLDPRDSNPHSSTCFLSEIILWFLRLSMRSCACEGTRPCCVFMEREGNEKKRRMGREAKRRKRPKVYMKDEKMLISRDKLRYFNARSEVKLERLHGSY